MKGNATNKRFSCQIKHQCCQHTQGVTISYRNCQMIWKINIYCWSPWLFFKSLFRDQNCNMLQILPEMVVCTKIHPKVTWDQNTEPKGRECMIKSGKYLGDPRVYMPSDRRTISKFLFMWSWFDEKKHYWTAQVYYLIRTFCTNRPTGTKSKVECRLI